MAIVCNPDDIPKIVRTIKSITSRELNIYNCDTIRNNENNEAFGLAQMNVNDNNENNKDKNIGASSNASCCKKDNNEAFGLAQMNMASKENNEAFGLAQMNMASKDDYEAFGLAQMNMASKDDYEAFGLAQMNVNDNNENNKDKNIGASSNASCCKKDNNEAFGLAQMNMASKENNEAFGLAQMNVNDNNENNKDKNIGASSNASCCKKDDNEAFGLAQMQRGFTQNHLWQAKYASSLITNDKELYNVLNYIQFNRNKHQIDDNSKLKEIIESFTIPVSDAFKQNEQKTGFDVVIGNPPYVNLTPNLFANFNFTNGNYNTYIAFIEKSLKLIKENGMIGFIIPNTWFSGDNYSSFRDYILKYHQIEQIIQLPYDIFQAYIDTSIVIINKNNCNKPVKTYKYNIHSPKGMIDFQNFEEFEASNWKKYRKIFLNTYLLIIGNKVWFSNKNILLEKIASVNRGSLPPHENEIAINKDKHYNIQWFDDQVFRYKIQKNKTYNTYVRYEDLRENKQEICL